MKQCIDIPRGWQRVIKSQAVIYITPSQDELKSKDDILQYLTAPGTCKCGLKCPLHLDSLFSFDAAIRSKENRDKYNIFIEQNEKPGKMYDSPLQLNETMKGPPISHSCNLKAPQKDLSAKIPTNHSVKQDQLEPSSQKTLSMPVHCNSPVRHKSKSTHRTILSLPLNPLPPISVFCQVNTYTVQQILQLLYSSLENTSESLKKQFPISEKYCGISLNNKQTRNISPCNYISGEQGFSKPASNVSSANSSPTLVDYQRNSDLINTVSDRHRLQQSSSLLNKSIHQSPRHNKVTDTLHQKSQTKYEMAPLVETNIQSMHTSEMYAPLVSNRNIQDDSVGNANDNKKTKSKQSRKPGNMLQIVQNDPSRFINQNNSQPPRYLQNQDIRGTNPNFMNHNVKMMNQQMFIRLPNYNDMPYYNQQQLYMPQYHLEQLQEDRRNKSNKSKTKKHCQHLSNMPKQPSIVIQPDHTGIRIDGTSKPTLLVSIGESQDKKTNKLTTKKQSPATSDANLTSVDSILKTCSNPILGNIPDIDNNNIPEPFSKGKTHMLAPKMPLEQPQKSLQSSSPNSTAQYSSMIPVQYLTPGSLIYGVPLVQGDKNQRENQGALAKTKNTEKWEGVLSPSEVDAKVQQILSSPQKSEDSSQANEKDLSPKKRKRQQSAPHMFDRYPGNPALRFQTGNSAKSLKLCKSEPQTPLSSIISPTCLPQNNQPPQPPHWNQFQSPFHQKNFPIFQASLGHVSLSDVSQIEGRKSR